MRKLVRDARRPREARVEPLTMFIWRAVAFTAVLAALTLMLDASEASEDALGGAYLGGDAAEGWRLELEETETGFAGLFVDHEDRQTAFEATGDAQMAVAERVEVSDRAAYFSLSARPIGLLMVWIPIAENGQLAVEEALTFPFIRSDVSLPEIPENLAPPPIEVTNSFDGLAFLNSYEFWTPEEVGRGYVSLTDRMRTLIRLYAPVHADVLWKLCQSAGTPEGLAEALDGQGVTCRYVVERVDALQRGGYFATYKDDLGDAKDGLMDAARCATGGLDPEQCRAITQATSARAVSLETVRSVLERYGP